MRLSLITVMLITFNDGSYGQASESLIKKIDEQLTAKQVTVSKVLSEPAYMPLHSQTAFREIIKRHAVPGRLTMVTTSEPGKKIKVKAVIKNQDGAPVDDALVYVYQTSDKGWYSDTGAHVLKNEGDMRHARLFGYLKTDNNGKFEFETVQPRGYPNSDLPAHIHIAVWKNGNLVNGVPAELLFDDDPRLTPERRQRSLSEGFLIEKNKGTLQDPVYYYVITSKR